MQSQARQDDFVVSVLGGKKGGCWLELGGNHPITISNTYYLEKELGWSGITVEMDPKWHPLYQQYRPNMFAVIADATSVNYLEQIRNLKMPHDIDYLQIDLEPSNRSPLTALEILDRTVMGEYHFNVVTFEHDIYTGNHFDTRNKSRDIFARRSYIRLFSNVYCNQTHWPFEDWYCFPTVLSHATANKIKADLRYSDEGIMPSVCIDLIKDYVK